MVDTAETKLGGVETHAEARKCAELFARHREEIDGVVVVLPNFGDEKGVADTLRLSGLNVPVLVQAYPDDLDQLSPARRRDAFCGKISVCNNLSQDGVAFLAFRGGIRCVCWMPDFRGGFAEIRRRLPRGEGTCAKVRIGAVGARPGRIQHRCVTARRYCNAMASV